MANSKDTRSPKGREGNHNALAPVDITIGREQETGKGVRPETVTLTEKGETPQITLKNGAVVDAREAAAVWRDLAALLTVDPDEFRTLLALAQDRPSDADERHFKSLRSSYFLEKDCRTIRSVVRAVTLNSFEHSDEGPLIVPLRLQNAADKPIAERALNERDEWVRNFATSREETDRSRE